ncbi:MAG TPA: hypothetical protein GXZ60_03355 [Intrasporangiaceae bacterium]|nr:hypothetical protein [Intrasporangiaceae bacterium]
MPDIATTVRPQPAGQHRRADLLIHAFAAVAAVATIGLLVDVWQIVFLAIPAFALVMMLKGSLRQDGTWDRSSTTAVVAYCAGLSALVIWSIMTYGGDGTFWGLPTSMGVIVYLIWPYTAVVAGALYAFVFDRTLKDEVAGAGIR